jgi:hypothetical protein
LTSASQPRLSPPQLQPPPRARRQQLKVQMAMELPRMPSEPHYYWQQSRHPTHYPTNRFSISFLSV